MVIIPLIADQFFNAYASQDLQIGQVVERNQLTPESIRAAVDKVLTNPLYREKARQLQTEMHALPNQQHAVRLVEQLAANREPILNPNLTVNL